MRQRKLHHVLQNNRLGNAYLSNYSISCNNVSVVGPWKHLCCDKVIQLLQLNRGLEQLNEQMMFYLSLVHVSLAL